MSNCKTVFELVREAEARDEQGSVKTSKYVDLDLREDINKINAYLNSKHISGPTDAKGREKPFFNIVNSAVNILYRVTDINRKNIKIKAENPKQVILSFLFSVLLQDWMKTSEFGKFLNIWGLALAKYLEVFVKFVEKDGKLICKVVPWDSLIVDPENPENGIKIERLYFTPAQLRKQNYNKDFVQELIDNTTTRKMLDGNQEVDSNDGFIFVYEVHGELPLSYLTGKEKDEDTYVQQMHAISFIAKKEDSDSFDEFTLYSGKEKDPYLFTTLLPSEDGSLTLNGAVKNLFEAQWMVNHSAKQIKDQLDLASKLFFQTSDGNFIGQNAFSSLDNGDILIHAQNQPLTQINNKPDITAMQAFSQQWQAMGNQINNISEAMRGDSPTSGTAWRLQQAVLQESHSLFELYTENKGLYLEEMLRKWVIPHLRKKIDTSEEISAILDDYQIKQIDNAFAPNQAIRFVNQKIKDTILSGKIYEPELQPGQIAETEEQLRRELAQLGNQRFIKPSEIKTKTWKEVLKDIEGKLVIDITGESKDIQAMMQTLSSVLQTIATNPLILQDPNAKLIFNKILEVSSGISPLEIQQAQPAPAMAGRVGGEVPIKQFNQ